MLDIPQYSVNWCGSARQARCINSYDEGFYFISDELLAPHKYGGGGGRGRGFHISNSGEEQQGVLIHWLRVWVDLQITSSINLVWVKFLVNKSSWLEQIPPVPGYCCKVVAHWDRIEVWGWGMEDIEIVRFY